MNIKTGPLLANHVIQQWYLFEPISVAEKWQSPECQLFLKVWRCLKVCGLTVTNYCHKAQQIINKSHKMQDEQLHSFSPTVVVGGAVTVTGRQGDRD